MKSGQAHGVRALLSTRKALLKKTMDLASEVRGLLKIFGIRLPMTVKHGSFDGVVRPLIEMDDVLAHAQCRSWMPAWFSTSTFWSWTGASNARQAMTRFVCG